MCRACEWDSNGNKIGGRRCASSDSSEKRRARRNNAKLLAKYGSGYNINAAGYQPATLTPEGEIKPASTTLNQPNPELSIEYIQDKIQTLHTIRDFFRNIKRIGDPALSHLYPQRVELADGRTVYIYNADTAVVLEPGEVEPAYAEALQRNKHEERSKLINIAEEQTREIGADIVELSTQQSGVTNEMIQESQKELKELEKDYETHQQVVAIAREVLEKKLEAVGKTMYVRRDELNEGELELYNAYNEARNRARKAHEALNEAARTGTKEAQALVAKRREAILANLGKIRPLGGEQQVDPESHKGSAKVLQEALSYYPTEWIEASNEHKTPRIKKTTARAHYNDGAWQRKYEVVTQTRILIKPADWEPDPTDKYEVLTVRVPDEIPEGGTWVNPQDKKEYTKHAVAGEAQWIRTSVEYAYMNSTSDRETPPKGRGWTKIRLPETFYEDGVIKTEERTQWYRPVKRRRLIEGTIQPEITISGKGADATRVALHEYAHRIEASPKVGPYIEQLEEAFLARRTTNPETGEREKLKRLYAGKKEYARTDNFINAYMGKEYTDGAREVLSTGAETLFSNSYGSFVGIGRHKADLDMQNFIVGLWASA